MSVIPLPIPDPQPQSCFQCKHVMLGQDGMFCFLYREVLWDGSEARDCEEYDE